MTRTSTIRARVGLVLLPVAGLVLAACAAVGNDADQEASASADAGAQLAVVEVHRAPGCGCCHEWEAYLRTHGFTVDAQDDPDIATFKQANGVPSAAQSCHTAIVGGYVVEGHVPVEAIMDLLTQQPAIDGIALPGMPAGSPGMPGEKAAPFEILALDDGEVSVFGSY